jgi:hypothetical protein
MNKFLKMIRRIFTLISVFLISIALKAQQDGSFPTEKFIKELKTNRAAEKKIQFDTTSAFLSVKLPVMIHIIKDNEGKEGINFNTIQNNFNMLNAFFKPININFILESSEIVDEYAYSTINKDDKNMVELIKKHNVQHKINIYFVEKLMIDSSQYYGFSPFPDEINKNYIFLLKKFSDANSIACMLGHFMGLLSTHERTTGEEYTDGSNCDTTGDLICDTYADPNIYGLVDKQCNFTGIIKDTRGADYVPSIANIMSNSLPQCKCSFTFEQYRRMYFYYLKYRQNLN